MNWRNVSELNQIISRNLGVLRSFSPDYVVGVPRSGLLAASIVSVYLNVPLSDPYSILQSRAWWKNRCIDAKTDGRILLIDDSMNTGGSMEYFAQAFKSARVSRVAIFGRSNSVKTGAADAILEPIDGERMFEWNIWKHANLEQSILDIDGVLCDDPTETQNDDGPIYREFIETARPLYIPKRTVLALCTSRLEKYREPTERWMKKHGVFYRSLHMLNHPDRAARIRAGDHAIEKARVYQSYPKALLFIESNRKQAVYIQKTTQRPVLSISGMEMLNG